MDEVTDAMIRDRISKVLVTCTVERASLAAMRSLGWILLIALVAISSPTAAKASEEVSVRAMSPWQGEGRIFRTGEGQAFFVGYYSGVLFVESASGALDAAEIVCPGSADISLKDATQNAEGRCIIASRTGDRVFAKWSCAGIHLIGCKGNFILTAGTGRFQGITGNGDFVIRSFLGELAKNSTDDNVQRTAIGLAVWPSLRYKIP